MLDFASSGNRGPNVNTYFGGYSPRVGFAYSPNNGKTSISGAFGITHFPGNFGAMGGFLERNYPYFEVFSTQAQEQNVPLAPLSATGLPTYIVTSTSAPLEPPVSISPETMNKRMQPDLADAWNFGVQQQLTGKMALDAPDYVGTKGTHLFRRWDINTPPPGTTPFNSRLPYKYFNAQDEQYATNIGYATADGSSIYHGLQVQLRKSTSFGLDGRISIYMVEGTRRYRASGGLLDDRLNRTVSGTNQAPDTPRNFIATLNYQLPFGRGRQWLSNASRPVDAVLGGWQLSTFTTLHSGSALTINSNKDNLGSGVTNHADNSCSSVKVYGSISKWFDTNCFTYPGPLLLGNTGIGNIRGPGYYNSDLSLSKSTSLHEAMAVKFQADFFNLSNTPHYSNPDTTLGDSNFGQIGGTNGTPREIQLGLHFTF